MCNARLFDTDAILTAVTALQTMLSSSRPILRHAAVRVVNESLMTPEFNLLKDESSAYPETSGRLSELSRLNPRLEALVADSNRTVATLAITALLKTGDEGSVERLLSQISRYVGEISDEHRLVVVEAVKKLAVRFPSKHVAMLEFLGGTLLREEGGAAFKHATVDAICDLVPSARNSALAILSDFIEDCEYPDLTAHILYLFGEEGSRSSDPQSLVRYLYNRLALEGSKVRLAALGALAKIATVSQKQTFESITSIIRRSSIEDSDDIVRDISDSQLDRIVKGLHRREPREFLRRELSPEFPVPLFPRHNHHSLCAERCASLEDLRLELRKMSRCSSQALYHDALPPFLRQPDVSTTVLSSLSTQWPWQPSPPNLVRTPNPLTMLRRQTRRMRT
jgi:coatomer protein complex subunit gamma